MNDTLGDIFAVYWLIAFFICMHAVMNDKEDKDDFFIKLIANIPVMFIFGGIILPIYILLNKNNNKQ